MKPSLRLLRPALAALLRPHRGRKPTKDARTPARMRGRARREAAVSKTRTARRQQTSGVFLPSPSVDAGGSFLLRCPKRLCGCGSCALSASSHRPPRAQAAGMLPPMKNGPVGSCRLLHKREILSGQGPTPPPSGPPLGTRRPIVRKLHVTQNFIQRKKRKSGAGALGRSPPGGHEAGNISPASGYLWCWKHPSWGKSLPKRNLKTGFYFYFKVKLKPQGWGKSMRASARVRNALDKHKWPNLHKIWKLLRVNG